VSAKQARYMMNHNVPLDMVQMPGSPGGAGSGIMQASANVPQGGLPGMAVPPGGLMGPPGMPMGPGMMPMGKGPMPVPPGGPTLPGAPMLAANGPMPPPGALPMGPPHRFSVARTQVRFVRPSGMKIAWFTMGPDGKPSYSSTPIETPGRYNFLQGAIYRLKLSSIDGAPAGLELYPTLEVVPTNPKTEAFLAHNAVPIEFTPEDFRQVTEGNYLVKVIYLPSPEYQELAASGTGEIVSTKLEPGADPIKEALRRGCILLVLRMGNMDQEVPNSPAIDAPGPHGAPSFFPPTGLPLMAPGMGPMPHGPGPMIPYTGPIPPMGPGGPMGGPMGPAGPMGGPMGPAGPMGGPMAGPGGPIPGPMPGPMPYQVPTGAPTGPQGGYPTGMPPMPPGMPPMGMPPGGGMPRPPAGGMPMPPSGGPASPGAALPSSQPTADSGAVRPASAAGAPTPGQWLPRPGQATSAQDTPGQSSANSAALPPTPAALATQDAGTSKR
jgi:hypothetical protein